MKIKLSKDREQVLNIISACLTGIFAVSMDIDWFKEVSIMAYISSSIIALISFVIAVSKGIYEENKLSTYYILGLFLVVLIIQIVVGKVMLLGIIVNLICFIGESSRISYLIWKEEEDKKEGKRLE